MGRRLLRTAQAGRVVRADQHHGHVRAVAEQGAGHLGRQVGRPGAGHPDAGEQHVPLAGLRGALGEQPGELAADRLGEPLHADADRRRVAEQHQPQRGGR
jgi:hypothetical protein